MGCGFGSGSHAKWYCITRGFSHSRWLFRSSKPTGSGHSPSLRRADGGRRFHASQWNAVSASTSWRPAHHYGTDTSRSAIHCRLQTSPTRLPSGWWTGTTPELRWNAPGDSSGNSSQWAGQRFKPPAPQLRYSWRICAVLNCSWLFISFSVLFHLLYKSSTWNQGGGRGGVKRDR